MTRKVKVDLSSNLNSGYIKLINEEDCNNKQTQSIHRPIYPLFLVGKDNIKPNWQDIPRETHRYNT